MWPIAQYAVPHFDVAERAKLYAAMMRGDVQVNMIYDAQGFIGVVLTVMYIDPVLAGNNLMIYGLKIVRKLSIAQWRYGIAKLINEAISLGCNCVSTYTHLRSVRNLMKHFGAKELTYLQCKI